MSPGLVSIRKLVDKKVFGGKDHAKHLGKIKAFIFHPHEKRCVGFVVKRPDVALMFHREDLFVAFDSFAVEEDGDIFVMQHSSATGDAACKRLGVDWETCLVWRGLPVVAESGETLGIVGDVLFDGQTGAVHSMKVDANASANALLGRRKIPSELIRGFRTGIGAPLLPTDMAAYNDDAAVVCGGILVANEAKDIVTEGLADAAGRKAGVAREKARATIEQAKPKAEEFAATTKEVASRGAEAAGKAINKGAVIAGEKLAQTKSMLVAFKEEYDKAVRDGSDAPAAETNAAGASEPAPPAASAAMQSEPASRPASEAGVQAASSQQRVRKVKKVRVVRK